MNWHKTSIEALYSAAGTSEKGLSDEQVLKKREEFGLNELIEKKKHPAWMIFLLQFKDFMILVLIGAARIYGCHHHIGDCGFECNCWICTGVQRRESYGGFKEDGHTAYTGIAQWERGHTGIFRTGAGRYCED
jgi:magnesium-transporting ATPase (P-type)